MEENKNFVADIVPIVSKITEHKLNGSNYIEWSKTIKIYLRSVAKDDHLTEEPHTDITRKLWMQDDAQLFLQMKNSINSDINAFHCPEKGAKSLTAYFIDFKKVYEELNALMPFSPDVRVQQTQREQMAVMSFLSGLPSEFETAKYQILSGSDIGSLQEVFSRVLRTQNVSSSQHTNVLVAKGENAENARRMNNRGGNRAFENRGNYSNSSDKIVTMTVEEFAKYSQYQDALKTSTPVSALAESEHILFLLLLLLMVLPMRLKGLDLMTKRTFGKGHVSDGLYILDEWVPRPVACVSTASLVEAHCRLGHPSLPVLKKLCPQFDTLPSLDFSTACFLINRMPTVVLKGDIPYKVIHPQKSLFPLEPRIFGCTCYIRDTRPFVTKLDPKALQCVFLGYSRLQKGYRCFLPDLNKYLVSTDVVFSEDTSFFSSPTSSTSEEDEEWLVYQVVNSRPTVVQSSVVDSDASLAHLGPVVNIPPAPEKPPIVQVYSRRPVTTDTCPAPVPSSSDPSSDLDLPISLRKGKRHCKSIYSIANFVSYDHLSSFSSVLVASIDSISVPKTVTEALNHPGWKNAMLEEICALEDNHTWKLVDLPQGKKVVGCKWVFAVKVNPDGSVARLKARLVARGYAQTYGVDYSDTFSPVAKLNSVRLFISIAASQQWMIHQLDIKNAFLHGDLEEEVYLEQPPGFVAQGEYGKVCRLKKAFYGLKQSPHAWFGKFSKKIQAFGMNKSEKDHSVFYKKSAAGIILLVVYVDDIVITGNDHTGISDLKTFMHSKFHTKDLDDGDPFYNPERYRRVVGKLNYLTMMRPNIAYAVSVVSRFTSAPTIKHWAALEQILCYLKKTPGLGILYSSQGHTRIECFSDADWAGSKFDRRSTIGYCVFFGGNLVAWKSKKQSVVSRSSAESEYRAMAQATCEIIWIHQLLCEVGMKCTMPAKFWCDNQVALHIAANPVYHERTKHIEVNCHFIREKIEENLVSTGYVKTGEQFGDIFTKALNGTRVEYFCNKLGMINIYAPT
ncbi:Retrovirus-related Pol polyprotein from transposon RE1 [Vitis vinifera]|uniref:Retrovirus-related Pol polyprotein from transposon RE1 n=1 Tax=Vitis vinifera TaxID=29760 RepID=A0A438DXX2_VITVI|nr:Retrovirus-related Pol polyprotein from transposon RE1 [Vitis vinifera]